MSFNNTNLLAKNKKYIFETESTRRRKLILQIFYKDIPHLLS